MNEESNILRQHSDDGDILIPLKAIQAARTSKDGHNAEVLLADGTWVRTTILYEDLKSKL